ncbi:MAG: CHAT domain-containing protein [Lysobacterales bacterium]
MRPILVLITVLLCGNALSFDEIDGQLDQADHYLERSELDQAAVIYDQVLNSDVVNPTSTQRARALNGMAQLADHRRDNEGLNTYAEQALAVAEEAGIPQQTAAALMQIGNYFSNIDQEAQSTAHYRRALEISEQLPPEDSLNNQILMNLAINATYRGDFITAERQLLQALDFSRAHQPDDGFEARVLSNLAYVYGTRNEVDKARDVYLETVDLGRRDQPDSLILANRLSNLGVMEHRLENIEAANAALTEALDIQLRLAPTSLDVARTTHALAEIAENSGELETALEYYQQSLALVRAVTDGAQVTYPLRGASSVLVKLERFDEALPLLTEALQRAEQFTPFSAQHARSLGQLGRLHKLAGEPLIAVAYLDQAIEVLEVQYSLLGGSAMTLAQFSEQFEGIYESLAELYLELEDIPQALTTLERFRERTLLLNLDLGQTLQAQDTPEQAALRVQAQQLLEQLDDGTGDTAEREILRTRLLALRRKLDNSSPERATALKNQALSALQEKLATNDRVLFFNLGNSSRYVYVIGQSTINVVKLETTEQDLSERVQRFRTLVQSPAILEVSLQAVGSEIYQALIAPLAEYIPRNGRLLIVPHKILHLLPFSALYSQNDSQYLLQRYEVVQAGSLSGLATHTPQATDAASEFVAFAYSAETKTAGLRGEILGPLPGAKREVETATAVLPMPHQIFSGANAQKSNLTKARSASILHFASHAVINTASPRDSYLLLAPSEKDDGRLSLWEIANGPRLSANLVVLSACSTAVGPNYAGEGVQGLAKAFSLAGAGGVVSSLWPVADNSTTLLMENFYRQLAAEGSPAAALRAAQQQLLQNPPGLLERKLLRRVDFSHPYYWAAFISNTP